MWSFEEYRTHEQSVTALNLKRASRSASWKSAQGSVSVSRGWGSSCKITNIVNGEIFTIGNKTTNGYDFCCLKRRNHNHEFNRG